jgi:hypothetical protein
MHNNRFAKGKKMKKLHIPSLLVLAATPAFAFGAVGLTGSYNLHSSIGGTDTDQTCSFAQADKQLTGSCKSDTGEVKLTGTVDGKKVTSKVNTEYNGEPLTVTYTGTLDDAGNVQGDADVQPMGVTGDFKLSPAKPGSEAPTK